MQNYNISDRDNFTYYYWNKLFLGIFIYELGNILYEFILHEHIIGRFISLTGIFIILFCTYKIPKKKPFKKNSLIKSIFIFYLFVNIITILRGLLESNVSGLIIHSIYFWQYALPFIIFLQLPSKIFFLLYRWCFIYIVTALLFCFYNFHDFYLNAAEMVKSMIGWESYIINRPQIPCTLSLPICLFIFNWKDLNRTHKIIITLTLILAILAALLAGRRSSAASIIFFLFIIFAFKIKKYFGRVIIIIIVLYCLPISTSNIFPNLSEKFLILSERLDENTRGNVETEFYKDFKEPNEWLWGRGMNGTYRCPSMSAIGANIHRNGIETGYLNIILHGGLCLLIPYIFILLYSIRQFQRKTELKFNNKAVITYLIFHIIWLYPAGTPQLGLEYFILWILISISLSSSTLFYDQKIQL